MQVPILRALALVTVGNAAIAGRDVSGFYPNDPIFQYSASLDFATPRDEPGGLKQVASGTSDWFVKLQKRKCHGLRLHNAPMQQDKKLGHIDDRLLVGMVGGGPRWLIEAVYGDRSELWEGFDRIGDKNAADKKIWLSAYILIGEAASAEKVDTGVAAASRDLRDALLSIEAVARSIPGQPFADAFMAARETLDGKELPYPLEFLRFTQMTPEAQRLLKAAGRAWVFGAMGSWNDVGVDAALKPRYESASKALFDALARAVLVVANSTYRR
ncbi:MAG: hypothetical protein IPL62_05790 [Caulobacteraceae bacterium]|nr:hypothetical protein [Caulobacteraceae bacterium]